MPGSRQTQGFDFPSLSICAKLTQFWGERVTDFEDKSLFERVLDAFGVPLSLKSGAVLFTEGDHGDALFVVRAGTLDVSVMSEDGRKLVLDILRPGSVFGEIALFDPGPRTATVHALEPAELVSLSNADARKAIADAPEIAMDLVQIAGQRMRLMSGQLGDQVFLPLSARLARRVLYLHDGTDSPVRLNQSQLAEFVGATREAVSKTLRDWKMAGLVEAHRGGLTIMDREALSIVALRRQY